MKDLPPVEGTHICDFEYLRQMAPVVGKNNVAISVQHGSRAYSITPAVPFSKELGGFKGRRGIAPAR